MTSWRCQSEDLVWFRSVHRELSFPLCIEDLTWLFSMLEENFLVDSSYSISKLTPLVPIVSVCSDPPRVEAGAEQSVPFRNQLDGCYQPMTVLRPSIHDHNPEISSLNSP